MAKKYIDADKLITEIKKMKEPYRPYLSEFENGCMEGRNNAIDDIISVIDSLQQEQGQYVIGGQVFGATDIEQLYKGKVYIVSNLVQDKEFGVYPGKQVKMLLIKD